MRKAKNLKPGDFVCIYTEEDDVLLGVVIEPFSENLTIVKLYPEIDRPIWIENERLFKLRNRYTIEKSLYDEE